MKKTASILAALMCAGMLHGSALCSAGEVNSLSEEVQICDETSEDVLLSEETAENIYEEWTDLSDSVSSMADIDVSLLQPSYLDDFLYRDIIKGDINGDGVVDLSDLTLFSEWLLGDIEISYEQLIAADVVCQRYSQAEPDIADFATLRQLICHDSVGLEYDPERMFIVAR